MTSTFFHIIDFLKIPRICQGYTDTSIDTKEMVACHAFLKSYLPISHPYLQDDFAVVVDQRLPDENPWDLNWLI